MREILTGLRQHDFDVHPQDLLQFAIREGASLRFLVENQREQVGVESGLAQRLRRSLRLMEPEDRRTC